LSPKQAENVARRRPVRTNATARLHDVLRVPPRLIVLAAPLALMGQCDQRLDRAAMQPFALQQ
jgi:hypothetical protein